MRCFYPDASFRRVTDISPEWVRERGISALLLDVDNTLTTHDNPQVPPEVAAWIARMRESGIPLVILSNNNPGRVAPFAGGLGLDFVANAAKPLGRGVRRAAARLDAREGRLALVGDQVFTDVLCAKWAGVVAVLVEPIEPEGFWFFRLKRRLERLVLRGYRKDGKGAR